MCVRSFLLQRSAGEHKTGNFCIMCGLQKMRCCSWERRVFFSIFKLIKTNFSKIKPNQEHKS